MCILDTMSKKKAKSQHKKRSKQYTGEDAATPSSGTKITRIQVAEKSRTRQWFEDNKIAVIARSVQALLLLLVAGIVYAITTWIF